MKKTNQDVFIGDFIETLYVREYDYEIQSGIKGIIIDCYKETNLYIVRVAENIDGSFSLGKCEKRCFMYLYLNEFKIINK